VVLTQNAEGSLVIIDFAGDVVPIERITDRLQRMRCAPYSIEMDAGACVRNYESVCSPDATPDLKRRRSTCLTCVDGQRIREQLQVQKALNAATSKAASKRESDKKAAKSSRANDSVILNSSPPAEPEREQPVAKHEPKPSGQPRCQEPGCKKPRGGIRKNTPMEFVGYCLVHRKIKSDSKRHHQKLRQKKRSKRNDSTSSKSSPAPKSVATQQDSLSLANASVLAELHNVCVNAQRYDLAVVVGNALATSVRERAEGG
jgi:hypothetical protein